MKDFGKSVCKIAIPVTLQSMLQSSFSIVDQLMIGQLGENSIAAVGLCGNFSLIFSVVMGAIGTVAGIMIAQFTGANDEKEAWRGFHVSVLFGCVVAAIFMCASLFFSADILGLYTKDQQTVLAGVAYFRMISFTFIPMAASTVVATWLRCNEHATVPLIASFAAVICNTGLNYILIFGKLGISPLGVMGAGYATVISQIINLVFMITGLLIFQKKEKKKMYFSIHLTKISLHEYLKMIAPLLVSEFLWSLGQNINSAVFGHIGTDSLAAYMLTAPIQGLFIGALSGLSAAAGVMIGKNLGKGDFEQAYQDSKKLIWCGTLGAILLSVILFLSAGFYVSHYQVEMAVKNVTKYLLFVFAVYAPVKVLNMILGGGIIRSGGDTKSIMIIDIIGTWLVGIPLCVITAYVFKMSIIPVYAIFSFEEVIRLMMTLHIFRKKKWMHSL